MNSYADTQTSDTQTGFAPTRTLALWTSILLAVSAILYLVGLSANLLLIFLNAYYLETVQAVAAGGGAESPALTDLPGGLLITAAFLLIAGRGFFQMLLFITTAILFLAWLYRSYKNLRPLGSEPQQAPGWAIGSWFVPLLNLVRPYMIVKETWVESDPEALPSNEGASEAFNNSFAGTLQQVRSESRLLIVWWVLWIAGLVSNNVATRLGKDVASVGDLIFACWIELLPMLLLTAAALLAIKIVREITRRQEERQRRMTTQAIMDSRMPFVSPPNYQS